MRLTSRLHRPQLIPHRPALLSCGFSNGTLECRHHVSRSLDLMRLAILRGVKDVEAQLNVVDPDADATPLSARGCRIHSVVPVRRKRC